MKCKFCNKILRETLILCCSCGKFCNDECVADYHTKKCNSRVSVNEDRGKE